ncbi:hypothetical protein Taro_056756 [Colocasia esculenta]|uniref:Uncharacterized protein n=1 Tax=Colocasia esculenta TaxID=4460 RepID=A0A843XUT7_COLES|nr:hypothetical protein [Colocasia esculenta]
MRLYVCRFMTPEDLNVHCVYVRRLMTTEDLNTNTGAPMTTCGVFSRTSTGGPERRGQNTDRRQGLSPQHVRPI